MTLFLLLPFSSRSDILSFFFIFLVVLVVVVVVVVLVGWPGRFLAWSGKAPPFKRTFDRSCCCVFTDDSFRRPLFAFLCCARSSLAVAHCFSRHRCSVMDSGKPDRNVLRFFLSFFVFWSLHNETLSWFNDCVSFVFGISLLIRPWISSMEFIQQMMFMTSTLETVPLDTGSTSGTYLVAYFLFFFSFFLSFFFFFARLLVFNGRNLPDVTEST